MCLSFHQSTFYFGWSGVKKSHLENQKISDFTQRYSTYIIEKYLNLLFLSETYFNPYPAYFIFINLPTTNIVVSYSWKTNHMLIIDGQGKIVQSLKRLPDSKQYRPRWESSYRSSLILVYTVWLKSTKDVIGRIRVKIMQKVHKERSALIKICTAHPSSFKL